MDGVEIAAISAGVPTGAVILLGIGIGKWIGTVERILKDHDKWIEGQEGRCKAQKDDCGKRFDYLQKRVNNASDNK